MKIRLIEDITPDQVDLTGFIPQQVLNKKLWIDNKLNPKVRISLLEIAYQFMIDSSLNSFCDVIITGSLANYNWNEQYSDIDLHVITDFSELSDDPEIARAYFNEKKYNWNQSHTDIKMFNYPVEIYVQDKNEPHKSSGVYSLMTDSWLIKPSLDKLPDTSNKPHIQHGVAAYCNMIDNLIDTLNASRNSLEEATRILNIANELYDAIKLERKEALANAQYAELTTGNLLFKSLRRNGYMEKLINLRRKCFDIIHSVR